MKTHSLMTVLGLSLLAVSALALPLQAVTFHVNVDDYTLYSDPNTGNEVKLGGFSGLFPVPGDSSRFYVVSDRGPTYDYIIVDADGIDEDVEYKVFLNPDFGPQIMTIQLLPNGTAEVEDLLPLVRGDGNIITGLTPTPPSGLVDVDLAELPHDPDGLDPEGVTIDPQGNFWVSDEYKPSVAMVSPSGEVLLRLVPEGTLTGEETVETLDVLPGSLSKRVNNRGLEGLTFAQDGTLYAIMQRPLANPDKATSEASRNIRLLAIDIEAILSDQTEGVVRQLIFRTELVHRSNYAADLFAVTSFRDQGEAPKTILLVPERRADKLFAIEISGATDITPYEDAEGNLLADPSLTIEMLDHADLAVLGIKPVKKTVVLNSMTAINPTLSKCEGVCLVGDYIVLTADNDFNLYETVVLDTDPEILPVPIFLQDPTNLPMIHVVPLPHGRAFLR